MGEISYKVELPDPYQNAYERVIMEFERRMRSREMEGIEAALKEHGFVKERTCQFTYEGVDESWQGDELYPVNTVKCTACGALVYDVNPRNYCPNCGARVVGD